MKNLLVLCTLCVALLAIGCSPRSPQNYSPVEKIVSYGEVGQVQDVRIGDNIIHYNIESRTDVLNVPAHLNGRAGIMGTVRIPAGIYTKTGEDDKRIFFNIKSTKGDEIKLSDLEVADLIYYKNQNKITVTVAKDPATGSFDNGFSLQRNARLTKNNDDFAMRGLSYAGSHGKLVSFEYREGKNKHRVTHNMDKGNVFKYQGAEIEIISYDENSITCKILKNLDISR